MNTRLIKLALVFGLLAGIAGVLLYVLSPKGPTVVSIDVVPGNATLIIDGSIKAKRGSNYLQAGTHTLKVSRSGFDSKEISFTTDPKGETTVNVALSANSEEGEKWLKDHPEEVYKAERFAGQEFSASSEKATQELPLINKLPFIDNKFRIDYGQSIKSPDDPSATAIIVSTYSDQGRQEALEWIRFEGYDPATLEIIYKEIDPNNP